MQLRVLRGLVFFMSISENLAAVCERVSISAHRVGRSPEDIALMAVSKTQPAERIREAYDAGQRLFGENRVKEFAGRIDSLRDLHAVEWHMIGHLQTNKAVKAAGLFGAIDSVNSLKLAEKLDTAARKLGKKLSVLIEINVGGEQAKSGVALGSPEIEEILRAATRLESLSFQGLMTVPPFTDDPQDARHYFRKLRELRDTVASRRLPSVSMNVLSMGMSHDFEVAIEEGSTCVRVGTAIFGEKKRN